MKKKRYLPFGYQMEKGEIIPHPDEGPLVQAIFSKYLERTALSTLAKYASLSGIPYREGAGQWNKAMVCRILDNSKYAGDEGFPPLISKEQLEEAAFLRAAKAKQYGGSLPVEMKKIRQQICCGNCGQILKRVNMRTGYILWECPKCGISTDYIPDELLLQSVTALLNRAIKNREKLKPEERHCECLSIEVLRLNNEIDRQMTNPRANADQLLQLIMDCAKAKYEVSESPVLQARTRNHKLRVAAYCRVSTEQEEQQTSIENQITYYDDLIRSNPEWEYAGVFSDDGISGTRDENRPGFMEMIKQCKKGKIDMILAKSLSRFSRNTLQCISYIRMLKDRGIIIRFEKEGLDTSRVTSEIFFTWTSAFAQGESESLSNNVKWGKRKGYSQGNFAFPYKNMLGYKKGEDGEPEIVPEEAEHIKMIFNLFLLGRSLRQIKEALERRNILTPRGNPEWGLSSIEHILRNEKYMGDVLLQKSYTVDFLTKKKKKNNGELTQYYITDNHPAIISREDFLNVQLELTRRNSKKKVSQKKTKSALGKYCSKYALSERLVCGECGSMYRRTTWVKKGKKKVVWRCISRLEFGTKYCQHSPTISEEALHQAILQCIQKVVEDKEDILKNLRDVQENIILFSGNQITPQSLEKQIDKLQQEMSALVKIIAQGGDSEFYAAKLRQLSEQKMGLTSQLQEIQKKKMADQAQEYQYQQALLYINNEENLNLTEFNDDFIRRIIEQITVLSATQIRIRFVGGYEQDANLPLKK